MGGGAAVSAKWQWMLMVLPGQVCLSAALKLPKNITIASTQECYNIVMCLINHNCVEKIIQEVSNLSKTF